MVQKCYIVQLNSSSKNKKAIGFTNRFFILFDNINKYDKERNQKFLRCLFFLWFQPIEK